MRVLALLLCAALTRGGPLASQGELLWSQDGRLTASASQALNLLTLAREDGLDPEDYGAGALLDRAHQVRPDWREFDEQLTRALARFVQDLHQGRLDPVTVGWRLDVPRERHDYDALVRAAAREHRVPALVESYRPRLAQYRHLRDALGAYRRRAGRPEPDMLSLPRGRSGIRSIHPGDAFAGLGAIAERLVNRGDLDAADRPTGETYGPTLADAVRRFQARHGLQADGVIGPSTMTALAVPLAWRARQLELAMERLRWLEPPPRARVIMINIPTFELEAWNSALDRLPSFRTGVVVGRARVSETPVMARDLREVIFRPYWNVPRSIVRGEILPAVARDPAYLARHEMELVDGQADHSPVVAASPENMARLARGEVRLRQRRGPTNALGLVKFLFPNEADVYMHGTPATALFARPRRDFSHGCVRVEDPTGLAEWVLSAEGGWPRERIVAAMNSAGSERVILDAPVQVWLFYTTAMGLRDGTVRFADDIYRQDSRLDRALSRRVQPAPATY